MEGFRIDTSDEKISSVSRTIRIKAETFDKINEIRNDAAHIFGHQITISSALALARDLESLGVDFSDSMGHYSEEEAVEYYDGLRGILAEIGWCVLFHAATILQEAGGRDIFAARETETR